MKNGRLPVICLINQNNELNCLRINCVPHESFRVVHNLFITSTHLQHINFHKVNQSLTNIPPHERIHAGAEHKKKSQIDEIRILFKKKDKLIK